MMVSEGVSDFGRRGPLGLSSSALTMVARQEAHGERMMMRWVEYCVDNAMARWQGEGAQGKKAA